MNKTGVFNVGDLISDSDQIYKIYKIAGDAIFYKPRVPENRHSSLDCSIPIVDALKSGTRPLLSKTEVNDFFDYLNKIEVSEDEVDYKTIKDVLYLNNPLKTAPTLKLLLRNKAKTGVLSRVDQDLLEKITAHLAEEISLVTKTPPEQIRSKIFGKK